MEFCRDVSKPQSKCEKYVVWDLGKLTFKEPLKKWAHALKVAASNPQSSLETVEAPHTSPHPV